MKLSGLVLLGCCLWLPGESQTDLVYKLGKIECEGQSKRVTNISCHVKGIDWNTTVVNMDCFLVVPVRNLTDYSNQYKPFLIDSSSNLCQVIERRNYVAYGAVLWKLMKQFTTVNHSCPFSGFYLFGTSVHKSSEYLGTAKFYLEAMEKVKTKKRPLRNLNLQ